MRDSTKIRRMKLGELRKKIGMTQKDIAIKMNGMDTGNLSRIENGRNCRISTLRKYVEALGGKLELVIVFDNEDSECIKLE